jgi:hypothetical protein
MMVRAHTLTTDPSYERYLGEDESSSVKEGDRILVPLQQIGTQYRQSWVQACIEKSGALGGDSVERGHKHGTGTSFRTTR